MSQGYHEAFMHPNALLIQRFYEAFQRRDTDAMIACYHPDIVFTDPVFQNLRGDAPGAMWRMLASRAKSLEVTFRDVRADDERGVAHWEAIYPFSQTGRRVHNRIDASFRFRDGKIVRHEDSFDLWRWASMALGVKGRLLGWLPPVQRAIRARANAELERYRRASRP